MNIFLGNSRKFSEQVFYRTARDGTAAFDVTQKILTTENSFSRLSFIKVNVTYSTSSSEMKHLKLMWNFKYIQIDCVLERIFRSS